MVQQLLIHFITWSVVNVSADVNYFRLIYLDTIRVSLEEMCELSVEAGGNLLWGRYLRVVKSVGFAVSLLR